MAKRKQGARTQAGRLRIVAGNWRSRLLEVAAVEGLRPTGERIRETLFNWLAPSIEGALCLDLFAGTGALGFEALSRGAAGVDFVEQSGVAAQQLRRNIEILEARGATVQQQDAFAFLRSNPGRRFDIVFVDPPFALDALAETCRLLAESGHLADDALVYIEDDRSRGEPPLPEGWQMLKSKTTGNVRYMLAQATRNV